MREVWIDYLRIVATIAVIVNHVAGVFLHELNFGFFSDWWIGLFTVGSSRFSVPIFIMISGALLIPKEYSLKEHITKRFTRVLWPFLFWSFIYLSVNIAMPIFKGNSFNFVQTIKDSFWYLTFGARGHLWYIYMILGLYLFIPIIQKWILKPGKNELKMYFFLWIGTLVINWFILNEPGEKGYHFEKGLDLTYFSGFLGYLILGYYLSVNSVFVGVKSKLIPILLVLSGLVITFIGTYVTSYNSYTFSRSFIRYLTPNILALSVGVFLIFKNSFNKQFKNSKINSLVQVISKYSFGIYLSHKLVLTGLALIGIDENLFQPIIGIVITSTLCLFISFLITLLINKLPFGKYVSG